MSETFRTWGTVGSKDQYSVLVDETTSVRQTLGQLCCLHRATARLQWKAAKGYDNFKPPQNERHCLAEYESQSAMNDDCWWNCGSKLLMLLGSRVTCPSLTDPCLKHLGHSGSGLWSQPAQIAWLAPKHIGIKFRAERWWIKLLPPISSPNHLGSAKNIQSLGINGTDMNDEIPAHDV